ncbi:uncharacterized protein LOC128994407 [Macrosteles quadrilineatus]|uniref:uncharacterized protein LOC128994407 n=1 Tax=Macrosteles quadrilineatus TaxID=74068 RepID=UPI0023E15C9B|nr:uncharacterized protein LOC128994407 [Macrosteles quadrilineatus]
MPIWHRSVTTTFAMKGIATLFLVTTLATIALSDEITRQRTVDELLGPTGYIKSQTAYNDEKEFAQEHIHRIQKVYGKYIQTMWRAKMMQKFVCVSKHVMYDFFKLKNRLSTLILVYMSVKNIPDQGELGLEIDTGRGKLVVPLNKAKFEQHLSSWEKFKGFFSCVHPKEGRKEVLPWQDLRFYLIEYGKSRFAPGVDKLPKVSRDERVVKISFQ